MEYKIEFSNSVYKDLKRLPPKIADKALILIKEKIGKDPFIGIPLKGRYKGLRKYRLGDYRIVYTIKDKKLIILILRICHRKNVYDGIY